MLCAISGEAPEQPVASRKSGNVYERRLIEDYISQNGTDPVNGEALTTEDLIDLKQSRVVKPRPPTLTSIPALLATFQNEWDALVLETYQLKQQLAESRQELSTALYYNDSAQRVIARLQQERDQARDALSRVSGFEGSGARADVNGDAMQVDGRALPEAITEIIKATQADLMATRRKRPIPEGWVTSDELESFQAKATVATQLLGARNLASDKSGNLFLTGDSEGSIAIFDVQASAISSRGTLGQGAILGGAWFGNQQAVSTSTGAVVTVKDGGLVTKFDQHAGPATALDVHPSEKILVSVGADSSYVLYDLEGQKVLTQVFGDAALTSVAFHPDGNLLAVGAADGSIRLYNVLDSQLAHTFPAPSASTPITSLSFSENGTWLASANKGQSDVTIWDLRKLSALKTIDIGSAVLRVSWDYTGQFLAAIGTGGVVVSQYSKSAKSWSEPLRRALSAVDVRWATKGKGLVVLNAEGGIEVLGQ